MTTLMTIMEDYFAYRNFKYLRLDGETPRNKANVWLLAITNLFFNENCDLMSNGHSLKYFYEVCTVT